MVSGFWMWMIVGFMTFAGLIFTTLMCVMVYLRTSGKWGGGVQVWDLNAIVQGGDVSEKKIVKEGSMYYHSRGGGTGVARRMMGMFRNEDWPIKTGAMLKLDETHFLYGLDGLKKVTGVYIKNYSNALHRLKNEMAELITEIQTEKHNKEELMRRMTDMMERASRAVIIQPGRKSK